MCSDAIPPIDTLRCRKLPMRERTLYIIGTVGSGSEFRDLIGKHSLRAEIINHEHIAPQLRTMEDICLEAERRITGCLVVDEKTARQVRAIDEVTKLLDGSWKKRPVAKEEPEKFHGNQVTNDKYRLRHYKK